MFELIQEQRARPILRWAPSFAGLLAAGWVAWLACPTPPKQLLTWDDLWGVIAKYSAALFLTSTLIGWGSAIFLSGGSRREAGRIILRTSVIAIWFAPLAIFLSERSLWSVPIMGFLVAGVATILRADYWATQNAQNSEVSTDARYREFLSSNLPTPQAGRRIAVLAVAAFAQAALVAGLIGISLAASLFFGLSLVLLTLFMASSVGEEQQSSALWRRPLPRSVLGMVLAILLAASGLLPYLRTGEGAADDAIAKRGAEHPTKRQRMDPAADAIAGELGPSFPGVILWPEEKSHVMLVPTASLTYGFRGVDETKPFSVPFDGVYWYLQSEVGPPPQNSLVTRGSPVERAFRTTRGVSLTMLARQNFGSLIDVSCCDRIQVEIRNADIYPGTVSLKLTLVNTTLPYRPSQYLGTAQVTSTPRLTRSDDIIPSREALTFFVPDNAALRVFDEVSVSFARDWRRGNLSAKIAIDRFVLIPKGRSSTKKQTRPIA